MTFSPDQLKIYIAETMRMSHVYQPVMLRVLLEQGGSASLTDIARALLSYDQSQVEYYELRTKKHGGAGTDGKRRCAAHNVRPTDHRV